jgi:ABC-type branched-subunit amino acid transport system ATPase component/ABC-type branched-subunit amino acid transport system permease subunit
VPAVKRLQPELLLVAVLVLGLLLLRRGLPLGIAGLGVVSGSVLALHAVGIVLLYSRTRILSFAQFGLGLGASVFYYLWVEYNQWAVLANGVCHCLAPHGASMSRLQHNPDLFRVWLQHHHHWAIIANALLSAAIGIFFAADAGRQVQQSLAKNFARAPRIVPTVATLAFAVLLGGVTQILTLRDQHPFGWHAFRWFPYGTRHVGAGDGGIKVPEGVFVAPGAKVAQFHLDNGARFHLYDIFAVVSVVLALVVVALLFTYGARGLRSRATGDNEERAAALGIDVQAQAVRPWRVAGALSGIAGVLAVSQSAQLPTAIDYNALTLVLAAVVLARLTGPVIAVIASVLLGVLDQGMFYNFGSHVQFEGSLFLVIGAALLIQRARTSRAEREAASVFTTAAEPLPVPDQIRRSRGVHGFLRGCTVVGILLVLGYPLVTTPRQLSLGVVVISYAIIAFSVLVLSGWGGQVSLGQFGFAAVGGYVAAIVAESWHLPILVALLFGAVAGAVVSPIVGLPAMRLPGPFVVIMTLAFSIAIPAVLLNRDLMGGALPRTVKRPVLLGLDLGSDRTFYYASLVVLFAAGLVIAGLRRSRLRRALIAGRDNEQTAASLGVNLLQLRIEGFAVAGFLAALGGGLLAFANGSVEADAFGPQYSVVAFLIVVIGGLTAVQGPILGAAIYGLVQLAGAFWLGVLNGFVTLFVLAWRPSGLAGLVVAARDAAIRVILHVQGTDVLRSTLSEGGKIALAERGAQAAVVPVRYRILGTGYGPVAGTRLRSVAGVAADAHEETLATVVDDTLDEGALLACHRVEVAYDGVRAVGGVSFAVEPGQVLAVVGTNGAGKTSLLRGLAGLEPLAHGTVSLDGADITMTATHLRARDGMVFVPGGAAVLPSLSVRENLELAAWERSDAETAAAVEEMTAAFPVLSSRLDTAAGNLSGGEQQALAIAQAFIRRPRVLLIDELSLGLSPEALDSVMTLLQRAAANGAAIVIVEQSISSAMSIADLALFLDSGEVRYYGPATNLRDHPELFAAIAFGAAPAMRAGSEAGRVRERLRDESELRLRIEGVSAGYGEVLAVQNVSIDVAAGEVVGVIGPNGAGKTTLFDCLSGTLPLREGSVILDGTDISRLPTHRRAALGLMRSYQNVRLFPSLTVHDNIAVALETRMTVKNPLFGALWLPPARKEERKVDERVDMLLELLQLQKLEHTQVASLSMGSRRLVDLACQLAARPKVLLLDEPTSGMAQRDTESIGPLISRISKDLDCAVLIVEHNVQVLASVTDRMVAMNFGAVIAEGEPRAVLDDPSVQDAYFRARAETAATPARPAPERELVTTS